MTSGGIIMDIFRLVILKELTSPASYCPLRLDQIIHRGIQVWRDGRCGRIEQKTSKALYEVNVGCLAYSLTDGFTPHIHHDADVHDKRNQ